MRQKRRDRLVQALGDLEAEFRDKLIVALHRCRDGQWGLFDQNGAVAMSEFLKQRARTECGAEELDRLGTEIAEIRDALGITEPFALHARLLSTRGRHTSNDLGEPRLASIWLQELEG